MVVRVLDSNEKTIEWRQVTKTDGRSIDVASMTAGLAWRFMVDTGRCRWPEKSIHPDDVAMVIAQWGAVFGDPKP